MTKGYQVSDDEINMDLTTFRSHYANSGGSVESVVVIYAATCTCR